MHEGDVKKGSILTVTLKLKFCSVAQCLILAVNFQAVPFSCVFYVIISEVRYRAVNYKIYYFKEEPGGLSLQHALFCLATSSS